jgi:UDP-GlcNAc:undecaprenyl-phosphate GlcNAc-1-phosphate transferase
MYSVILAFLTALAVTACLTPLVRRLALALGAVDDPTARRVHTRTIPRMGGIAIVLGFFLPLLAVFALNTGTARIFFGAPRLVAALVTGSLLVAGLGLFDDIVGVGAKAKLAVQIAAGCIAFAGGLRIDALSLPLFGAVPLGILALPATVLWIIAIINALNLIDGLDGLAGGVAFFACLTNFIVAVLGGNILIGFISATLAGAIVGFLFFNFNPAKIFMGDSGSMFLGFVLACSSLLGAGTQKSPTIIAILVPLIALGLPIMDMLFAVARRFMERRSIFSADRGHIHHRLLDLGLTHRRAVLVLYGVSLAFTLVALAMHFGRSWQVGGALVALTVLLVGVVRFVGYINARLALGRVPHGAFVDRLRRGIPNVLTRFAAARSADEIQAILELFAQDHGILAVSILAGQGARLASWRWEMPEANRQGVREAVSAKFAVKDSVGVASDVEFFWDSPETTVSPQAEILLQLVADGAELLAQRAGRARAATASGRLRPVGYP